MLVQNMNIKWKHLHGRNHTGVRGHTNCGPPGQEPLLVKVMQVMLECWLQLHLTVLHLHPATVQNNVLVC